MALMEKRRTRYQYDVRVAGKSWIKATRIEPATAAAQAAARGWAKGMTVEIVEIKNGQLCPFTE